MGHILICGGAGYIGSHANKRLNEAGYKTIVFDNLIYGHKKAVKWGEFVEGDLADRKQLDEVFRNYDIDAVMHFAAFAYVGESMLEPEKYYHNNVSNTINLLSIMREYGCNKIIFSSTCATYGISKKQPIVEETPQYPVNPYGASKLMVERILKDYHLAYGLNYVVLRYFNAAGADPDAVIGESHNPETHLIPLIFDAASGQRESIKVFGTDYDTPDGSCVRDYIHVSDLADAHLLGLEYLKQNIGSVCLNLGNTNGTSVLQVIDAVKRVTGRNFKVEVIGRRIGDPAILVGSSKKAMEVLGWQPKYSDIEMMVAHAWRWYKNKEY